MDDKKTLSFTYGRQYGIEIEMNDAEKRDFKARPLKRHEIPVGAEYVAHIIQQTIYKPVQVKHWHNNHNNDIWVVKPDSSCGLEVCSPVLKGWNGLKESCRVIDIFDKHPNIYIDGRCSMHLHVDVSDCDIGKLASIVAWWIKCEGVFLDSVPESRKINRYCECIGMSRDLQIDWDCHHQASELVSYVGKQKYYSMNTFHLLRDSRATVEYRIIENQGCRDAYLVKNWVRLILHLVDRAIRQGPPAAYDPNDPMTGLQWLDPIDVMKFLGFIGDEYYLSKGMEQTRNWFLGRLNANLLQSGKKNSMFAKEARKVAADQVRQIILGLGLDANNMEPWMKTKSTAELYAGVE